MHRRARTGGALGHAEEIPGISVVHLRANLVVVEVDIDASTNAIGVIIVVGRSLAAFEGLELLHADVFRYDCCLAVVVLDGDEALGILPAVAASVVTHGDEDVRVIGRVHGFEDAADVVHRCVTPWDIRCAIAYDTTTLIIETCRELRIAATDGEWRVRDRP